jgi:putative membrane protein
MKTANPTHVRIAAGVAAVFLAAAAQAATPRTTTPDTPAPVVRDRTVQTDPALKRADRTFIEKAAKSGLEEVEISRIAADRTSNPDVKRFAQMIIADHESAHEELGALASMKGVNLPAKENAERWAKRDAKNFDREYIDKMVADHDDAVKLFEKHAKDGNDVETVAFARKHLPKLQSHLQQASDLKRMLKNR